MSAAVVDAIQTIFVSSDQPLDLNRVEILTSTRQSRSDHSRLVKGLVLDHGGRHPDMPDELTNVRMMTCNLSLEYEQTETQAGVRSFLLFLFAVIAGMVYCVFVVRR